MGVSPPRSLSPSPILSLSLPPHLPSSSPPPSLSLSLPLPSLSSYPFLPVSPLDAATLSAPRLFLPQAPNTDPYYIELPGGRCPQDPRNIPEARCPRILRCEHAAPQTPGRVGRPPTQIERPPEPTWAAAEPRQSSRPAPLCIRFIYTAVYI